MTKKLESSEIQSGACRFCGQIYQFETSGLAREDDLDDWATEKCDCPEAKYYTQRKKSLESAKKNIKKLFGKIPYAGECVIQIMSMAADAVFESKIGGLSIKIENGIKGTISMNSQGKIKVERIDTIKSKYEQ